MESPSHQRGRERLPVEQLKKTLREVDKPAVEAGWWSLVLEQVDDGIR